MEQLETILKREAGKALQCRNCEYEWTYRGNLIFASCPSCRHAVKVRNVKDAGGVGAQDNQK